MLKFIGYKNSGTIKPLCIILAYLLNILKTTKKVKTFLAGDDDVILKYNKIWKKLKRLLSAEFDSHPVYDEKCIKTRVKPLKILHKIFRQWNSKRKYSLFMHCCNLRWFCNKIRVKKKKKKSWAVQIQTKKKQRHSIIWWFDDELEDSSDESEIKAE